MTVESQDPSASGPLGDADVTLAGDGLEVSTRSRSARALTRGEVLGRYVVLDRIGQGGMGVVYAAYDPELDRRVAIKLVHAVDQSRSATSTGHGRLLREAKAMARLSHSNVVSVFDVGALDGAVFVAMEFIEGEDLGRWISEHHAGPTASWREALALFIDAGRGLAAAHQAGIVHRDFKPENVMRSREGRVVVLDFGLARAGEGRESSAVEEETSAMNISSSLSVEVPLTRTGRLMGTPAYMAPEQLAGQQSDAASDQFSFCVALYYALYGERPFTGQTLAELVGSVTTGEIRPAPRASRVPTWLRAAVVRGLAREPAERYPSMDALLAALASDRARRRVRVWGAVAAVALVVAAVGVQQWAASEPPCPRSAIEARMAEVWNPDVRHELGEAFVRDDHVYTEQSLSRVEERLDDYEQRWVEQRQRVCEAAVDATADLVRDATLRGACLDHSLRRMGALVRLLADADPQMVYRAPQAVSELANLTRCEDAEGYRRVAPVPDDAALQEQVESIRARTAEPRALLSAGRPESALEEATTLLGEARALGYEPVVAELLAMVGGARLQAGLYPEALESFEEALLLARVHGLDDLAWHSLHGMVFVHTAYTGKHELAQWQAEELDAMVRRLGNDPKYRAETLVDRARLARERGEYEASVEMLRRAVAISEQMERDSPGLVKTYDNLATSLERVSRPEEAAEVLARAEQVVARALGPDHPLNGNLRVHAGRVEASRGRHAEAVEHLRGAVSTFEAVHRDDHPNIGAVLNGLGLQLEYSGEPEEAIVHYERSLQIMLGAFGGGNERTNTIRVNLGNALRRQGDPARALELHEAALASRRAAPDDAVGVYEALDNIADDLRVLGRYEEAISRYEEALRARAAAGDDEPTDGTYPRLGIALCRFGQRDHAAAVRLLDAVIRDFGPEPAEPGRPSSHELQLARMALAMSLRETGDPGSRADELARKAREQLARFPAANRRLLDGIDAWLAGGGPTMPIR